MQEEIDLTRNDYQDVVTPVNFEHRYAHGNDIDLHYVIGGEGRGVVLLHGWPYTWAEWRRAMPLLAEAGYTVIAPDLRGLGESATTDDGFDKRNVAEDIHQLMTSIGVDNIDLVGVDIGMMVAYAYCIAFPDGVRSAVLGESLLPGFGLEDRMNPATGGYWHFGFHMPVGIAEMLTAGREAEYLDLFWKMLSPDMADEARTEYFRRYTAPGAMRAGFKHYEVMLDDGTYNRSQPATSMGQPTLVLNGDHGIPLQQTLECVAQVCPSPIADVVPQATHAIAEDNPAWFVDRLHRFFSTAT